MNTIFNLFPPRLMDLSGAVKYEGAVPDRCLLEEKDSGAVLPDEQEAEPTPEPVPPPPHTLSALTPGSLTVRDH